MRPSIVAAACGRLMWSWSRDLAERVREQYSLLDGVNLHCDGRWRVVAPVALSSAIESRRRWRPGPMGPGTLTMARVAWSLVVSPTEKLLLGCRGPRGTTDLSTGSSHGHTRPRLCCLPPACYAKPRACRTSKPVTKPRVGSIAWLHPLGCVSKAARWRCRPVGEPDRWRPRVAIYRDRDRYHHGCSESVCSAPSFWPALCRRCSDASHFAGGEWFFGCRSGTGIGTHGRGRPRACRARPAAEQQLARLACHAPDGPMS